MLVQHRYPVKVPGLYSRSLCTKVRETKGPEESSLIESLGEQCKV